MLGKRSILIFLLSVNIYAQKSLKDELNELKVASESIDLSDWTALSEQPQQNTVTVDSIGLTSSALKKEVVNEESEETEAPLNEVGTIRYRSR